MNKIITIAYVLIIFEKLIKQIYLTNFIFMKKTIIAVIFCLVLWFYQSYAAITFSWTPRLDSATSTSLNISWDSVPGAIGYYLYYSEASWVGKGYDRQYPDLIEGKTNVSLADLDPGKTYYVALTAIDWQGEESPYSSEVSFSTQWGVVEGDLSVEWLKITDKNTLVFEFSLPLDDDINAVRDIKIVDKASWEELTQSKIELDGEKSVKVTLENELIPLSQYDITIISIFSKSGKNIEAGIDGLVSFTAPSVFDETTLNKNILEEAWMDTNEVTPLNSWSSEIAPENTTDTSTWVTTWESDESNKAWVNVSNEDLNKNTVNAVNASKELPQTGPEHMILLLISLMVGWYVFYNQKKKQSN